MPEKKSLEAPQARLQDVPLANRRILIHTINEQEAIDGGILPTVPYIGIVNDGINNKCRLIIGAGVGGKDIKIDNKLKQFIVDVTNDPTVPCAGHCVSIGYHSLQLIAREPKILSTNPLVLETEHNITGKFYVPNARSNRLQKQDPPFNHGIILTSARPGEMVLDYFVIPADHNQIWAVARGRWMANKSAILIQYFDPESYYTPLRETPFQEAEEPIEGFQQRFAEVINAEVRKLWPQ